MYKSGISAVVAMVLIILITIVLVVLLWVSIIPFINLQIELAEECRRGRAALSVEYACRGFNSVSGNYIMVARIKRSGVDFKLEDIQIGVGDDLNILSAFLQTDGVLGVMNPPNTLPGVNQQRFYTYEAPTVPPFTEFWITPVVSVDDTLKICDPNPTVYVNACS